MEGTSAWIRPYKASTVAKTRRIKTKSFRCFEEVNVFRKTKKNIKRLSKNVHQANDLNKE
jgi:hypothetical protein